jgi:putative copper resistance protein D|tara:strand:+ start:77 stop:397 length:321 start_codon:yes stop_codon:yes gene_type:complete
MTKFGKSAVYPIGGLIIAGLLLAWQLVRSVSSLLDTNYGFVLLVKLLFVGAIFLIALLHKLRLAPQLLTGITSPRTLQKSIQIELCIGISILMVTVVLSTAVGPNY